MISRYSVLPAGVLGGGGPGPGRQGRAGHENDAVEQHSCQEIIIWSVGGNNNAMDGIIYNSLQ